MAISKIIYKENAEATPVVWMDTTDKTADSDNMLNGITALKNDGTTATGNIASKTSSDLTASGATVTAPAGYYASSASKSVSSGSATTPATTITANPSISVSSSGLITASASATKSVTPTVSAGYVSSGTAGTITVSGSNTSQLTTQAAQTIYPSTSDQTIASGKYLTGAQTVKGVLLTNLDAGNIKKDVVVKVGDSADDDRITSVTGTYEGSGGGGGPSWPDPSTVTDLTGTTWYMNDTIDHTSLPQYPSKYNVLFFTHQQWSNAGAKPYGLEGTLGTNYNSYYWPYAQVYSGLYRSSYSAQLPSGGLCTGQMWGSSAGAWINYQPQASIGYNPSTSSWSNNFPGGRLWTFIPAGAQDGAYHTTDHTNATLIAWMKANGTLILKA